MKLLNFAVINLTLSLIAGISLASFLNFSLNASGILCGFLFFCLVLSYVLSRKSIPKVRYFSFVAYLFTFSLGLFLYHLHDETNQKQHYSNHQLVEDDELRLEVIERLKPSTYENKYVAEIKRAGATPLSGKLLLSIEKDSTEQPLKIGQIILTTASLENLPKVLNPYQFDYGSYLRKQHIHQQISIQPNRYIRLGQAATSITSWAAALRENINKKLRTQDFEPEELAIINALLLGQRQDMDPEIYSDYVNAGAVHILAVSGLHVGIIWLILSFLFRPLMYLKNGQLIGVLLTVLLLWGFAVIAGLSPSVTRAVTMFSVITLAKLLRRPTNIYNTLATSALLLLLVDPNYLFQVGFQMSYLAVLGIVTFRPAIIKYYYPENTVLKFFYNIFVVSIAAQLGVLPLSLFYFHQFPILFLLSNLVILPCLGIILGFGILVILLALLNVSYHSFFEAYGWVIRQMNHWVEWVSRQESFLFTDISFNHTMLVAAYGLIIALLIFIQKPKIIKLAYVIVCVMLLQLAWVFQKKQYDGSDFIVFHKNRHSLMAQKRANMLNLFSSLDSLQLISDRTIKDFKVGAFSDVSSIQPTNKKLYRFDRHRILCVDSLGIWNVKSFQPDIILLNNSPKINLDRLIDTLQPVLIVADGSNYTSYTARWRETCMGNGIPFHSTRENGFLSLANFKKKEKP